MSPAFYIVLAFAIAVLVTLFVIVARTLPSRHQQQNFDENAENQDGQDEAAVRGLDRMVARRRRGVNEGEEEHKKIGTKKLKKLERKEAEKQFRQHMIEQEKVKREEEKKIAKEERKKEREQAIAEQAKLEELEELQKARERADQELLDSWKDQFVVKEAGTEEGRVLELEKDILQYLKDRKTVKLEDMAAQFRIPIEQLVSLIEGFVSKKEIFGVFDRGSFLVVSDEVLKYVTQTIKDQGRISIESLMLKLNVNN